MLTCVFLFTCCLSMTSNNSKWYAGPGRYYTCKRQLINRRRFYYENVVCFKCLMLCAVHVIYAEGFDSKLFGILENTQHTALNT